jgi:fumarate reductase flavoprotein subunit
MSRTGGAASEALARALAASAGRAVDWLQANGADYLPGRFWMAPSRGRQKGLSWEGWGPDLVLRRLTTGLEEAGGAIILDAACESLLLEDGRCAGITARVEGRLATFEAGAVFLADGGFHGNDHLIRRFICSQPEKLVKRNSLAARGDGLLMAEAAGAALAGTSYFYGHLLARDALHNAALWPYPTMDLTASAGIVVRGNGRRFADEGKGGVYLANAIAWSDDPLDYWTVVDDDVWSRGIARRLDGDASNPDSPNPDIVANGGTVLEAASIEELAVKAGMPPLGLRETVDGYNAGLSSGSLGRLAPARSDEGNPQPVRTPPFRAIPLCVGITKTMGGPAVDEHCRVLRPDGSAIPGLFVIGSAMGGLEGGEPAGYFGGLSQALIGGLLAAEYVARTY